MKKRQLCCSRLHQPMANKSRTWTFAWLRSASCSQGTKLIVPELDSGSIPQILKNTPDIDIQISAWSLLY